MRACENRQYHLMGRDRRIFQILTNFHGKSESVAVKIGCAIRQPLRDELCLVAGHDCERCLAIWLVNREEQAENAGKGQGWLASLLLSDWSMDLQTGGSDEFH